MSKKTRKKSSKGSAKTPARHLPSHPQDPAKKSAQKTTTGEGGPQRLAKAPVKTPAAKAGKAVAKQNQAKQPKAL